MTSTIDATDPEQLGNDRGLLAGTLYRVTTRGWNEYLSLTSFPCLKGRGHHYRRDVAILMFVATSVLCFGVWPYFITARWVFAAWAFYRLLDHSSGLVSLAFFDTLTEPNRFDSLPRKRVERLTVLILLTYLELLFIFAVLYLWIDVNSPDSFIPNLGCLARAFFMSVTTMTTVGYGNVAPVRGLALAGCTCQAVLAVVIIVIFLGNVIAVKRDRPAKVIPFEHPGRWYRYLLPFIPLAIVFASFYGGSD